MSRRRATTVRIAATVAASLASLLLLAGSASAAAPSAITGPVTTYGPTSATVGGTVNPNGEATTWHVEYGKTTTYGTDTASVSAGSGTANTSVTATLTNLEPGTTYHYRLVATNGSGTNRGADGIVTTSAMPAVVTDEATSVTTSSATLTGTVNPNGRPTTWYFEYGRNTSYGTRTPTQNAGSGTGTQNVSASISGLQAGATYHYRLVATSDAGTSRGADRSFMAAAAPTVSTSAASSVSASAARLNGRLNANGRSTTWYFEYGTTTSYGSKTSTRNGGSGTNTQNVSVSISRLSAGTTYHFRLVASNSSGTSLGNDQTFTTAGPPTVQTGGAQSVGTSTATLTGSLDPRGFSTSWYFEYGTTTSYGSRTSSVNAGSGTGSRSVSSSLSGLVPSTTYHFRLVASSSAGTSRGADVAFTTQQSVTLTQSTMQSTYGRFVTLSGTVSSKLAGVKVTILAQPFGETSFATLGTALTGNGGAWTFAARPAIRTVYQASADGGTSGQAIVGVRPAVSLRVITKRRLSTRVVAGTSFATKIVKLQRRVGNRWVTVRRARLNAKSSAIFKATALPRGRSVIRIAMSVNQAGPGYLGGFSRTIAYRRG
jgi:hypothetical protein